MPWDNACARSILPVVFITDHTQSRMPSDLTCEPSDRTSGQPPHTFLIDSGPAPQPRAERHHQVTRVSAQAQALAPTPSDRVRKLSISISGTTTASAGTGRSSSLLVMTTLRNKRNALITNMGPEHCTSWASVEPQAERGMQ